MIGVLASIRPDSWNFPLFLHVLGAMTLVGAMGSVTTLAWAGWLRPQRELIARATFWTMLVLSLPAWLLMRLAAEWIYSKEFGDTEDDPAWIGIGFMTREGGGLLLLIATICAGIASRKSKSGLARASGIIAAIALAAWIVAVWAMAAKPS